MFISQTWSSKSPEKLLSVEITLRVSNELQNKKKCSHSCIVAVVGLCVPYGMHVRVWNRKTSNETSSPSSTAIVDKAQSPHHKEAHLPRSLITCSFTPNMGNYAILIKYSHSPPNLLIPLSHHWAELRWTALVWLHIQHGCYNYAGKDKVTKKYLSLHICVNTIVWKGTSY